MLGQPSCPRQRMTPTRTQETRRPPSPSGLRRLACQERGRLPFRPFDFAQGRPERRRGATRYARPGHSTSACRPSRMERETGIEPATNSLEGCDSTTELLPPAGSPTPPRLPKTDRPRRQARLPSRSSRPFAPRAKSGGEGRIRTSEGAGPTDLQSVAFDRSATSPNFLPVSVVTSPPRHAPAAGDTASRRQVDGAGEGIRTPDRLITNQLLYRTELRQPDERI